MNFIKMKKIKITILVFCFLLLQLGCTESFDIESIDYESVLVVESTITNEMKQQVVKLSRTTPLDEQDVVFEENAQVVVETSNGEIYGFFQDAQTGDYISNLQFQAEANVTYTLKIDTQDGKRYTSSSVSLPAAVAIDQLYAEQATENGGVGVNVLVDTFDETGNAKYFRYEFEETYRVVAPYPSRYNVEITNYNVQSGTYDINLTNRQPEEICYSTEYSTGIIQTSTNELSEDRVFRFPVQFISKENPVIQSRYSILVKQYVQSLEAYTFYKTIKELGSVESLLSQGQPGYVAGNMKSEVDPDEKVLGYFEASSITSKRIYFNYEDFGFNKPPYFIECENLILDYLDATVMDYDPNEREAFYTYITYFDYQVYAHIPDTIYYIVQSECSVCTSFSSNVKPDFWED